MSDRRRTMAVLSRGASWLVATAASMVCSDALGRLPPGPPPPQPHLRTARAHLRAAVTPSPRGQGALAEYRDNRVEGVVIDLWIDGAVPGSKRVSLVSQRRCRAISGQVAVRAAEEDGDTIGTINIDEQGHGMARLEIPGASLTPTRARSLLGRGLMLADERDLACGIVRRVVTDETPTP